MIERDGLISPIDPWELTACALRRGDGLQICRTTGLHICRTTRLQDHRTYRRNTGLQDLQDYRTDICLTA